MGSNTMEWVPYKRVRPSLSHTCVYSCASTSYHEMMQQGLSYTSLGLPNPQNQKPIHFHVEYITQSQVGALCWGLS